MKKIFLPFVFLVAVSNASAQEDLFISISSAKLKSSAQFWGNTLTSLNYGDKVSKIADQGDWAQVKTSGNKTGFLHKSSYSNRKIVLKSSPKTKASSPDTADVVLAGKGFNPEVEKNFSAGNPSLNFADVNYVEKIKVSDSQVMQLVKSGGLVTNE